MSLRFSEPAHSSTVTSTKPIATSYDTICAAERNAPKKRVARIRRPAGEDDAVDAERADREQIEDADIDVGDRPPPTSNGITAQATRLSVKVTIGAMMKTTRLAPLGMIVSLISILSPSAKGCSSPNGPTTFGPLRNCENASTLRSA